MFFNSILLYCCIVLVGVSIIYVNGWLIIATSPSNSTIWINKGIIDANGLYLYFDATSKDGSSSEQKCYITAIEFE